MTRVRTARHRRMLTGVTTLVTSLLLSGAPASGAEVNGCVKGGTEGIEADTDVRGEEDGDDLMSMHLNLKIKFGVYGPIPPLTVNGCVVEIFA